MFVTNAALLAATKLQVAITAAVPAADKNPEGVTVDPKLFNEQPPAKITDMGAAILAAVLGVGGVIGVILIVLSMIKLYGGKTKSGLTPLFAALALTILCFGGMYSAIKAAGEIGVGILS